MRLGHGSCREGTVCSLIEGHGDSSNLEAHEGLRLDTERFLLEELAGVVRIRDLVGSSYSYRSLESPIPS